MVRRRTASGAPAQSTSAVPGQTYGDGVAQETMARAMPVPDGRGVATPPSAPIQAPTDPAAAPAQGMSFEELLARAPTVPGGILTAPTARPNEPITHGLPMGPGAGPEVLRGMVNSSPGVRFLRNLAAATGDPYFDQLADRVGR